MPTPRKTRRASAPPVDHSVTAAAVAAAAGGSLITSTRPTLNLQTESSPLYEHSPRSKTMFRPRFESLFCREVIEVKHSTDVESSPPHPPRLCMTIHPEGKSCLVSFRELVFIDPPARRQRRRAYPRRRRSKKMTRRCGGGESRRIRGGLKRRRHRRRRRRQRRRRGRGLQSSTFELDLSRS